MAVLILAKHDNAHLNDATSKTVTAAKAMGGDITVLVAGQDCAAVAEAAAKLDGVAKVIHVEGEAYGHRLAEPLTELVRGMADGYEHIVFPATTSGKNVAPRLAALLDVMVISDITGVVAPDTFERPIYAGNAIQTVQSTDPKKVITVRGASFAATGEQAPCPDRDRGRRRRPRPLGLGRGQGRGLGPARAHLGEDRRLRRPRPRLGGELRASSRSSPTSSAPPSAPPAPRSTPATPRTTGRSARPARWSRPSSTSPSASPARSSTSPA